jgi:hypothetical protein
MAVISSKVGIPACNTHVAAQAHPGKTALVVLHENTTRGFSRSANKGAQISNCLFRLNGAALIMSSRCGRGACIGRKPL